MSERAHSGLPEQYPMPTMAGTGNIAQGSTEAGRGWWEDILEMGRGAFPSRGRWDGEGPLSSVW